MENKCTWFFFSKLKLRLNITFSTQNDKFFFLIRSFRLCVALWVLKPPKSTNLIFFVSVFWFTICYFMLGYRLCHVFAPVSASRPCYQLYHSSTHLQFQPNNFHYKISLLKTLRPPEHENVLFFYHKCTSIDISLLLKQNEVY